MPAKPVACGRFQKLFGVRGEIRFEPYLPNIFESASPLSGIALKQGRDKEGIKVSISSARSMSKFWAVRLEQFSSPEEVSRLINMELFVERSLLPDLQEGEYYEADLIGLKVLEENGSELGNITSVISTGANDVWEVTTAEGKEILLPVIDEVILDVDIEAGILTIHLMEGLAD